jgi:hypothetical protein
MPVLAGSDAGTAAFAPAAGGLAAGQYSRCNRAVTPRLSSSWVGTLKLPAIAVPSTSTLSTSGCGVARNFSAPIGRPNQPA